MLLPAKQMHLAVIIGIQRWVYLPNRSMAATVSVPSGRINRRLRSIFSQSCPLAMAEHIISSDASLKASPVKPFFSKTLSKRLPRNCLIVVASRSLTVASLTPASSGAKLPQSVIISASSALSNTLRLSAPFFTHTIPLLS